jgi:hypothetical protein
MKIPKQLHSMLLKPQNNYKFKQEGKKIITERDGIRRDNDETTLFKLSSISSATTVTNWLN